MTDTTETTDIDTPDTDAALADEPTVDAAVREAVESLKNWQENAIVIAIANGIRGKYLDLMLGMKKGNPKAGPYTYGYLEALKDIHASLQAIIKNEEIPDDNEPAATLAGVPGGSEGVGEAADGTEQPAA